MEYLEIVMKNVKIEYLDNIIDQIIKFETSNIISSHFFDIKENIDLEIGEIDILCKHFSNGGTGNIYLKEIDIGTKVENALMLIESDKKYSDIIINFCEQQLINGNIEKMINKLVEINKLNYLEKIVFGYEPAEDDDMIIFEIIKKRIKIFNKEFFKSELVNIIYDTVEKSSWFR